MSGTHIKETINLNSQGGTVKLRLSQKIAIDKMISRC